MRIRALDTANRRDVRRWVDFPYGLYRDIPQWVPPLRTEERANLDQARNPFYSHSTAGFFVAEADGRFLGRIAIMHNTRYVSRPGEKPALFGLFEVVEDIQVARGLFAAAFEWARARGLDTIVGPKGLVVAGAGGALVEGFEHRPALMIPYNPPYYGAFIEDSGFEKWHDSLSGYIGRGPASAIPPRILEIAARVKERSGFWIKTFASINELWSWIPRISELQRVSFQGGEDSYPMSDEEALAFAEGLKAIAEPRLVKVVMKGEEPIGFILAYPDVSAGLQKARGRLFPFGWWHILRDKKKTDWVNVNGVGILPQRQGRGANAVLYAELGVTLMQARFQHADTVQVGEDNFRSFSDNVSLGVKWYKRHRLYRRGL
ncbi:MAG: hypothetical protein HYZ26_05310 [Chloroflexi bacterium]|nr:hypothetical protein [Chloroflexota bacterium]